MELIMFLNNTDKELYFIYGLIAIILVLIVIIIIIDKLDSKKTKKSLSDTMSLKPIEDPANFKNNNYNKTKEVEKIEKSNNEIEVIDITKPKKEISFKDITPIPEVKVENYEFEDELLDDDEIYHDTDLEKTQAQLRVEEITKALEDAQIEEKIEQDKYVRFEEEQEKNAIISYKELKEEYDRLYEENEKNQYLEDNEIPININELFELNKKEELELEKHVEETKKEEEKNFKNSPYISPVYGIQKPVTAENNHMDVEIKEANDFLNRLKELKDNLD